MLFLLGQEQLCIQPCVSAAAHLKDRLTCWDSCLSNMTMLWLSLLTLMMLDQSLVTTLPLRFPELPAQPHVGPPEADLEFAEVFTSLYMEYDPWKKVWQRDR